MGVLALHVERTQAQPEAAGVPEMNTKSRAEALALALAWIIILALAHTAFSRL